MVAKLKITVDVRQVVSVGMLTSGPHLFHHIVQGSTSDQQIVVHASPNQPPTAVVVLFRLLAQQLPVRTAVYVHSSLKSLPGSLCQALKDVPNCADSQASQAIRLVLVWREGREACADFKFLFSPVGIEYPVPT